MPAPPTTDALLRAAASDRRVIGFAGGLPSVERFPRRALAAAFRRSIERRDVPALQYAWPEGFSPLLPQVSYHIAKDRSSLLSYSHQSDVWTLDPIAAEGEPGWEKFAKAFNERCSAWGGTPLFNQTPFLERRHVLRAFGDRLDKFEATRRRFDPGQRMLNDYFAKLLSG